MGTCHVVGGVPRQLFATAGSCEPNGVGEPGAQPCCVSGGAGDLKMPGRVCSYGCHSHNNSNEKGGVVGHPWGRHLFGCLCAHPLSPPGWGCDEPPVETAQSGDSAGSHSEEDTSPSVDLGV